MFFCSFQRYRSSTSTPLFLAYSIHPVRDCLVIVILSQPLLQLLMHGAERWLIDNGGRFSTTPTDNDVRISLPSIKPFYVELTLLSLPAQRSVGRLLRVTTTMSTTVQTRRTAPPRRDDARPVRLGMARRPWSRAGGQTGDRVTWRSVGIWGDRTIAPVAAAE